MSRMMRQADERAPVVGPCSPEPGYTILVARFGRSGIGLRAAVKLLKYDHFSFDTNDRFQFHRRVISNAEETSRAGASIERVKRPFLKWAGGKTGLVFAIRELLPPAPRRLIEPFVGSGAVALNLGCATNVLADANRHLIDVYLELQRDRDQFIAECETLFTPANNSAAAYYALRTEFNGAIDRRRRACLFVYLNRHGYNGLCRYNASGGFNVPFGRYTQPRLPRDEMFTFHALLRSCTVEHADFRDILARAGEGDFVYCDPPYVPASATANFTSYAQHGFTPRDQEDLAACCRAAKGRGACVAISNHDTGETRELYRGADECHELLVSRRISCDGENRIPARELLVVFRPQAVTSGPAQPTAA